MGTLIRCLLPVLYTITTVQTASAKTTGTSLPVKPHLIHEFPLKTYLLSTAVRKQDGNIVITVATGGQIYLVSTDHQFEPIEVATLPGVQAACGIVETCENEFYVAGGNLSVMDHTSEAGSFSVWKLDMRHGDQVDPKKIADFPDGLLLDRIMQWDAQTLFVSDSILGVIWSLNIHSGEIAVALNDTATMNPVSESGVGVNYMEYHHGFLYYGNSEKGMLSRIPVDRATGTASGPAEVLIKSPDKLYPQGFTFRGGDMWMANSYNQVFRISDLESRSASSPAMEVVAGHLNGKKFAGLSDCKFGTKPEDLERGSLYVSSIGKSGDNWTFGGAIWRLDVGPIC